MPLDAAAPPARREALFKALRRHRLFKALQAIDVRTLDRRFSSERLAKITLFCARPG